MVERYHARCASDRDPTWPLWYVADRQKGDLNVLISILEVLSGEFVSAYPFAPREICEALAGYANEVSGSAKGASPDGRIRL